MLKNPRDDGGRPLAGFVSAVFLLPKNG